jgi:hypothetical protein
MSTLTLENLKPRLNLEDKHKAFLADFPGDTKENQAAAIRLIAQTYPEDLLDVDPDRDDPEYERNELLAGVLRALPAAPNCATMARIVAVGLDDWGEEMTDNKGNFSLLDAAVEIANLHSPVPSVAMTQRHEPLAAAIERMDMVPGMFNAPFRPIGD